MVKERDIENIFFKSNSYSPIKKNLKIKECLGFDTETEKGKAFLIAYFNNEEEKQIKFINNFNDIVEFLFYSKFRDTINFFYNINYDFQAIIKHIPIKNLKELAQYSKTDYEGYNISFINNKCFSIEKNKNIVKFFDLAQFYNFMSLKNAGNKYLALQKENLKEYEIDIKNLSADRYNNDTEYKYYMDKYLYQDVRITKYLGTKLYEMMTPYLIPKSFYSQASFSQQYYLENLTKKINLPNKNILQYALNSYQGGRFEVFKRGYFKKAYIQDIKSAYPYHNASVPDLSKGIWKKNNSYEPESLVSIYKIDTKIYDLNISPLKYQLKNSLMIYPIGDFKDVYVNKTEIELLEELGFSYKIENAYHYFDKEPEYPYDFLEDFYKLKEQYKKEGNEELSWIPKILMNGFYGKMIQLNDKQEFTKEYKGDKHLIDTITINGELIYIYKKFESGKLFNPIVANEITANTRTQLFKASFKDIDKIIGFQTDSIISETKLNLDFSDKLGSWDLENNGEMVILGSGIYQMLAKKPKIKMRGFNKELDLMNLLRDYNKENQIKVNLTRNIKLKKIIKIRNYEDELNISDTRKMELFNLIKDEMKIVNINFDKKRVWERDFLNCEDVLNNQIESKPIII